MLKPPFIVQGPAGTALWSIALLIPGVAGMLAMAALKTEIRTIRPQEDVVSVKVVTARPRDLSVTLKGYGETRVLNTAAVSSEVKGRLIYVSPGLEPGASLLKGDLLFQIDPEKYQAGLRALTAEKTRLAHRIKAIEIRHAADRDRLDLARETQKLVRAGVLRRETLFRGQVGSALDLDAARQDLNRARDLTAGLERKVASFPHELGQARAELEQALARLGTVREDIRRCRVYAPFDCRVKERSVEAGAYVTPGQPMARLADDTVLELKVTVDSRDARQWLHFHPPDRFGAHWFSRVKQVDCRVCWVEDPEGGCHQGRVHRVVEFRPGMGTLVLAVRLGPADRPIKFPIVEGMFCRVEIPGRTMEKVFRLPDSAVYGGNTVFLADKGRLMPQKIEIVRIQGDQILAGGGLNPGDRVVVTRLANPVKGTKIKILSTDHGPNAPLLPDRTGNARAIDRDALFKFSGRVGTGSMIQPGNKTADLNQKKDQRVGK